jgi:YggT family protein
MGTLALADLVLQAYTWVLLAYVILSWVPRPPEALVPLVIGVHRLVDPVVRPLRRAIPPLRLGVVALDLSVLVLFLLVGFLRRLLVGLA